MTEATRRLQSWLARQCNGEWEHRYGVRIETIDNPGWLVRLDLIGTSHEKRTFTKKHVERTEQDWIRCDVRDAVFEGYGGPENLVEILETALSWLEA